MGNFWEIVSGAPWWVYALFVYLVILGIKATKPRTISIKKVVLLPLFFLGLSIYGLYYKVLLGFPSLILVWVVFLAIGAYFGVKEVSSWKIVKNHHKGEITIPGNYSTLVLIFLIFILKFFWGYYYETHSEISYWVYFTDTLTSALVTGFFVGRTGFFLKSYQSKL